MPIITFPIISFKSSSKCNCILRFAENNEINYLYYLILRIVHHVGRCYERKIHMLNDSIFSDEYDIM